MLKLQYKDQRKAAIWLVDERYSIGQDPSNDVVLTEGGVAAFHAELSVKGDEVSVKDMGGNGTFVNGEQVDQPTPLNAGDTLKIDSVEFVLADPKDELNAPADDGATAITPALSNLSVAPSQKPDAAKSTPMALSNGDSGWALVVKTGTQLGTEFPIPLGKACSIGRSSQADIVLTGSHVSRKHAEVEVRDGSLHVRDLGSANGTYINRRKMLEGNVKDGDELRLDTITLTIKGPKEDVAPAAAPAAEQESDDHTAFRPAATPPPAAAPAAKPAAAPAAAPAQPAAAQAAAAPDKSSSKAGIVWGIVGVVVIVIVGGLILL